MIVPMNCIKKARIDSHGQPVPPKKSTGIKWAVISAVAVLAAAILAAGTLALLVIGGMMAFTGVNIAGGIMQMCSAVMLGLATASLIMVAIECIKNAKHHLPQPQAGGNRLGGGNVRNLAAFAN